MWKRGCGTRCPLRRPSQTFSESSLSSFGGGGEGTSSQPQGGPGAGGGCLTACERKDNSLMGAASLLFKMDHTQLDKYCKNVQMFLFTKPSVYAVHCSPTCGGFPSSGTCYRHRAAPALKDLQGPTSAPAESPQGTEGSRRQGWPAGPPDCQQARRRPRSPAHGSPNSTRCPVPLGSRDKCQLKAHIATLIIPSSPRAPEGVLSHCSDSAQPLS